VDIPETNLITIDYTDKNGNKFPYTATDRKTFSIKKLELDTLSSKLASSVDPSETELFADYMIDPDTGMS